MRVFVESFLLPKGGNQLSEYEDAYYPPLAEGEEKDGKQFRFSVSDGASAGILSGQWAQILTKEACDFHLSIDDTRTILETGFVSWASWLQDYLQARNEQDKPIKWYEETGLRTGAFATILVFELNEELSNKWQAVAIGDSCLFQVRGGQLITRFPIKQSDDFNNTPALLCSISAHNEDLDNKILRSNGEWQIEDEFYLMTDAIAQWFLAAYEDGQQPWDVLRDLNTTDASQTFERLIDTLRENKNIRNDDITLVRVTLT